VALLMAVVALLPASMLVLGALVLFVREQAVYSGLQLIGAGGLMVVVLIHVSEALQLFPGMGWGLADSAGHYLDLVSAVLGLTFFPAGYLGHALSQKPN
jgi:hypothetical protein